MIKPFASRLLVSLLATALLQGQSPGWRQFPINDPVLNMTAWSLAAPADWTVEGTMMPGSSCNSGTSPIFKAVSPDGRAGVYLLPRSDWAWGAGVRSSGDCLPWQQVVSAKRFLAYQMHAEHVGFVSDESTPELADERPLPGETIDMARALVRYSVHGQVVDERLSVTVRCSARTMMAIGEQHACFAMVRRWFAPTGKLNAMLPTFGRIQVTLNQQWWSSWQAATADRFRRLSQAQTEHMLEQGRLAESQRMQAHQAYMASAQHGYDVHNEAFRAGQFQKQSHSDDFVDYILDCQRSYSGSTRVSVGYNCPNRQTP